MDYDYYQKQENGFSSKKGKYISGIVIHRCKKHILTHNNIWVLKLTQ